jgi:CubicO group peptidase (beta-lactamase class C family)
MKRIVSVVITFSLIMSSIVMSSCSMGDSEPDPTVHPKEIVIEEAVSETQGVVIEESAAPDDSLEWQYDVNFPDWQDRSMYGANNRMGFFCYQGQGSIFITPDSNAGSFNLYINDISIDTADMTPGTTYELDISGISRSGTNSLQLSSLTQGEVNVKIPYPVVIDGTLEDAGIAQGAVDLIDSIINADIENGFPSAQMAIVRHGQLVYQNAWGNVRTYDESGAPIDAAPVTNDTLYDLASVTKVMSVNYALQYLVTQGLVDIDTPIVDILGDRFAEDTIEIQYEGYDAVSLETNKQWKSELTIRDLLQHQGGFPAGPQYFNDRYDNAAQNFDSDNGNILYVGTGADEASRELTLDMICQTPLMYEPGTDSVYSDLDYMILCYVVEAITGQRIDEFLEQTFWDPMGLDHITYNPLDNGFTADDCAATELMGNSRDGNASYTGIRMNTIQGEVHDPNAYYCMAGISGHAGLFSNATDLAILASVMLSGGYGNNRYFSVNVMDEFTSIQDGDNPGYGLGWWREGDHTRDYFFGSVTDSNTYGHQGFTGTLIYIDPENDLVIAILTNKIHSNILAGDPTLNSYNGNFYTTASLGFAPEIIEIGLDADNIDDGIWADMATDMAADMMRSIEQNGITDQAHPKWRAYDALMSVVEELTS